MAVAHHAVYFRLRRECGNGVDHHDTNGTGTDERLGNLESLLTVIRLGHEEIIDIHTDALGILHI